MKTLTVAEFTEALDQVVQERGPDYVYQKEAGGDCFYSTPDGQPDCVVGAVLAKIAPEVFESLALLEAEVDDGNGGLCRAPAGGIIKFVRGYGDDEDARYAPHHLMEAESRDLAQALLALQTSQDVGETWGEARREFIGRLRSKAELVAA
ncbi:hypothetical protein QDW16_gp18 [Microbacterium phage Quenya]|uniref:hypothetical protein n=1 Tax=Microbacterium phage Quenya TaxID=2776868 RepID=UPI0018A3860B|nr:hypothetical protein QDW16_gp18 [Microbacterium phage Quenya]QOP64286.1 hypothetical protein SEA_QUENYA_51 [Microbacterium phage Quenya]